MTAFAIILALALFLACSLMAVLNLKNENRILKDDIDALKKENRQLIKDKSDLLDKVLSLSKHETIEAAGEKSYFEKKGF